MVEREGIASEVVVPGVDLRAQYRSIKADIDEAIGRVIASGEFERGPELDAFEAEFARFCGTRYAVGVGSGYAALFLALKAADLGSGDEVITTANTDMATISAISHTGATPVLVDIDARTHNIDPDLIEAKVTTRTRALMPIHLYGLPADMDRVMRIAERHGLIVVEDAALALGARYKGRRVGGIGQLGCFSFAPNKILGAYGDGGMVTTDDARLADQVRLWGSYGEKRVFERVGPIDLLKPMDHDVAGYHNHLDTLQAAILSAKLPHVEDWIERRRHLAAAYGEALAGLPLEIPYVPEGYEHVYRNYVIQTPDPDQVRRHLARRGVSTYQLYIPPVHLQTVYQGQGYQAGDLPVTEAVAQKLLCLPIYAELTEAQVAYVGRCMAEVL
jgi:dTDP-4-amino-4,6-dideoxygalactose transaminase